MIEYIRKEEAVEMLLYNSDESCASVISDFEAIPAADVVEIQHGKWENGDPICPVCGEDKFKGLDADIWADWKPKYCPNCGARMDKVNG